MQKTQSKFTKPLAKGFTLLEMMMVLAIIGILVGGVIGMTKNFSAGAKIQKTESEMQSLAAHLLQYKNLAGRFPTTEQGLQALVTKPTTAPKPRRWTQTLTALPRDPWGNDYIYKMPGSKDSSTYEIISYGSDGVAGGDDDISSQDEAY
ncbi:type II secretion system major pseudopilin GspG [Rubritalea marina]|uniref:type II secretion system major pseudopilin GspG n=1 Tax=Rubritalea marina TaxID=361055 RepID=UPI00037E9ECC|nr:type II secretion system major pseudopilin GspG [Rubritalea marina]